MKFGDHDLSYLSRRNSRVVDTHVVGTTGESVAGVKSKVGIECEELPARLRDVALERFLGQAEGCLGALQPHLLRCLEPALSACTTTEMCRHIRVTSDASSENRRPARPACRVDSV
jgi:hypothetical protein